MHGVQRVRPVIYIRAQNDPDGKRQAVLLPERFHELRLIAEPVIVEERRALGKFPAGIQIQRAAAALVRLLRLAQERGKRVRPVQRGPVGVIPADVVELVPVYLRRVIRRERVALPVQQRPVQAAGPRQIVRLIIERAAEAEALSGVQLLRRGGLVVQTEARAAQLQLLACRADRLGDGVFDVAVIVLGREQTAPLRPPEPRLRTQQPFLAQRRLRPGGIRVHAVAEIPARLFGQPVVDDLEMLAAAERFGAVHMPPAVLLHGERDRVERQLLQRQEPAQLDRGKAQLLFAVVVKFDGFLRAAVTGAHRAGDAQRQLRKLYCGAVFGKLPPAPLAAERRVRCRPAEKIGKAVRPEGLISGGE